MATLIEAVGGDTFGGLSGYRRPTAGNPTRVPTNLPAFRGVTNKPGSNVAAPSIQSSKNRNNRGTNVLIPYSRITTYEEREVGGRLPGDLAFLSSFAPNMLKVGGVSYTSTTGHDVFHYSRVVGLYALNQMLAFIDARTGSGKLQNVLVDEQGGLNVGDHWFEVPTLDEYRLDGIVLSNDLPDAQTGSTKNESGQLYNIAIQGPTPVNNGYVTERGHGMLARPKPTFSLPPIPVRSAEEDMEAELFRDRNSKLYQQPNEYLYSEQMFSRNIEPMDELFCALVATKHDVKSFNAATKMVKKHDDLVKQIRASTEVTQRAALRLQLRAHIHDSDKDGGKLTKALRTRSVYDALNYVKTEDDGTKTFINGAPAAVYTFQYWLCTSARLIELSNQTTPYNLTRNQSWTTADGAPVMPIDHNARKPNDLHAEKHCDALWMTQIVGAWRVGTVMDIKAAQAPFFEGGPVETGNRVTVNVGVRWLGWRELRRLYTCNPKGPQVCEAFVPNWTTIAQGSLYDPAEAAKRIGSAALEVPDRAVAADGEGNMVQMPEDGAKDGVDDLLVFQWPAKPEPQTAVEGAPPRVTPSNLRVAQDEFTGQKRKRESERNGPDEAPARTTPAAEETPAKKTPAKETPVPPATAPAPAVAAALAGAEPLEMEVEPEREVPAPAPKKGRATAKTMATSSVERARMRVQRVERVERPDRADRADRDSPARSPGASPMPAGAALSPAASPAASPMVAGAGAESPTRSPGSTGANVFARRRSTPSPSPDRPAAELGDDAPAATAGAASSTSDPVATDAAMEDAEELLEPKQKKTRVRPTSDVFSSIFGGGGAEASRLEPLNPAHRGGEKFRRRRRG
jgi:hypothetical protein